MPPPPHASIGIALDEVDTPALVLDLDALERNLLRMADAVKGSGVRLRPHAKSHKCAEIARAQIAAGAVGVCCQKVSEAEALVAGGVADVLVTNEIVGKQKLACLARLVREAKVGVLADDAGNVAELDAAARAEGVRLDVLVEVNVGADRCGIAPGGPALELARGIAACGSLRFAGLHAYHGSAQHVRGPADRRAAIAVAAEKATPSGKLTIESKSIAAGIGITWGDGKLNFKGKDYPFSIDGLTLVDFGISKASATGDVYNLTDSAKLAGTYVAAEAGITLAGGVGGMVLRNQDGVVIHIRSTSKGAKLQLGTSGLTIKMK